MRFNKDITENKYLFGIFIKQIVPSFLPNFQKFFWYFKIKGTVFGSRNPTYESQQYPLEIITKDVHYTDTY